MRVRYILLVLLVAIAAIAYLQRGLVAQKLMALGAEAAMNADVLGELGPGLHLVLCGAGGPMPDPKRSGPCVAVVAGGRLFVVDAGTNGARNLVRLRYPLGDIEAVFLTHFHSDHIDGLGELALLRWVQGNNTEPLPVIGPEGVGAVVEGFNAAYSQDAAYRTAHHGEKVAPPTGSGMNPRSHPLPPAGESVTVYEEDGVRVQMFAVEHEPVSPAVGYLFTHAGRSLLVSGDTIRSANIERFAEGVDLLVHEALAPNLVGILHDAAETAGNQGLARITTDILEYHTTPVEAAQIARDAGAGHLLYYHIVPPLILPGAETAWLEGVDEVFPEYTLGQDGASFSLPPDSAEIIQTREGL